MLHLQKFNWYLPAPSRRAWNWKDLLQALAIVWLMCIVLCMSVLFAACETPARAYLLPSQTYIQQIHIQYTCKPFNEFAILTEKLNTFKKWKTFKRDRHAEEIGKTQTTMTMRTGSKENKNTLPPCCVRLYRYTCGWIARHWYRDDTI